MTKNAITSIQDDDKQPENTNQPDEITLSKSFEDIATHDKIQRHLSDINDTISEEDIKNVRTDIGLETSAEAGEEEKALIESERLNESSENETADEFKEGKKITSSWNILSE